MEGQLSIRPKIVNCKPEVGKDVIEKIETQLEGEVKINRGIEATIARYKHPAGGVLIDDYSWTIEVLK